ncbi:MAG: enoyl-CoA hydratase-related protein [Cytophagaceae bacterium]|jgi:methylglutaconyl-CoA hydratase|nr:enoyl-CoA hydratase-related protein [Cytophagaceae bacterium]
MHTFHYVLTEVKDRIYYLTLNRPEKRNALNHAFVAEIKKALLEAIELPEVKVVVIKANGDAFCAGADLEYLQKMQHFTLEENLQDSTHLMELFKLLYTMPKVVIAQVQGHALAGGCGLVSVCDFSFSVPEANYGYTEARIGFIPAIVMVFLLRKIGEGKAKQLLLTGSPVTAKEAQEIGVINWIVEEEDLETSVQDFALRLCKNASSQSLALTKQMISEVPSMSLDEALRYACRKNAEARNNPDCKRGIAGFLGKEKLEW